MSSQQPFRTSKPIEAPCDAVVVHCSDHRFQEAFREFVTHGLGISSYAPLIIPGGGHFGAMGHLQPKFAKAGLQSLRFLIKRTGAPRIVLIGHHDCLFFKDQLQFFFTEASLNQKQITNLKVARDVLKESFDRAAIELAFLDIAPDGSIEFRRIE